MADVYCDQALGTGADDGTSWINAYRVLATALDGTNVGDGDTLWVKGNLATSIAVSLAGTTAYSDDPPQVIGCKSATSATPPAQSDLIPGLRTGQSVFAYDDADAPTLTVTTSGADISINGHISMYGLILIARDNFNYGLGVDVTLFAEECHFRAGNAETGIHLAEVNDYCYLKNCKISGGTSGQFFGAAKSGRYLFERCIIDIPTTAGMIAVGGLDMIFDSCDFSSQSNAILDDGGGRHPQGRVRFNNCKIHASSPLTTGSITEKFRSEFFLTSSATGKTTGQSYREVDILTDNGAIVEETTRVRTGGADDGSSGAWSLAYTPNNNGTRDGREGMIGPKMAIEVTGDGTAQTLSVFIANSSASTDYDDDEVWLVAKSPSEAGTADYDFYTTQMDWLATPAPVPDDTGSTWGSGANYHQKLSITLSPDYDGIIECWVVFAKNFASSADTLYVDPLPVLT